MSLCSGGSDDPIVSVTRRDQRAIRPGRVAQLPLPPASSSSRMSIAWTTLLRTPRRAEVMADADDLGDVRPADPGGGAVRMARFVAAMSFARRMAPR